MKLLLLFLFATFAFAVVTADRTVVRPRAMVLIGICAVLAIGFSTRRFI